MALQRKNFRCPRDVESPLKSLSHGGPTGVVISHAELPPRQRKRVQVGSTNLFRSVSSPELPAPLVSTSPEKSAIHSPDVSSAAHHISETNIALVKASMRGDPSRRLSAASATGVVVLSEKRRLAELRTRAQPTEAFNDEGDTHAQPGNNAPLDHAGEDRAIAHAAQQAEAAQAAERAFFLATRQKLFEAFVDRYGSVRAVFRAFDRDANGLISYQRFADMVDASEVALTPADIQRVFRHVDVNGDNSIAFQEFSEMFTASEYDAKASAYSPTKASAALVTADPTSSLSLKFRAPLDMSPRSRERMKELRLKVNNELRLKHGRGVSVHGGKTENLLIHAFKQFDVDNDGFLSYDQVKSALGKDYLQLAMGAAEMDEMVRLIDRNADEQISMKEFVQYFGAGERELPTDLLDNGRRKALAALHHKAHTPLTPRQEIDPAFFARREPADEPQPAPDAAPERGCLQENLARRIATSPVFRAAPAMPQRRAQTSHAALLTSSPSTPVLQRKSDLGPTLNPLVAVSQDRHTYFREQRTDWSRVGVGGDGVRVDSASFASPSARFETTMERAFSPLQRGVNSGDVFRDAPSTSEAEAQTRATRREARHERTQALVAEMAEWREKEQRLRDWKQRAKVRLGAARQFTYLDKIHDSEQRVAMREQQMAKRHGGARFHRMWAGSADSQFNTAHVTGD